MLFNYTFGEKLDLTRFQRQAAHYIAHMPEVSFHCDLPHYRVVVEVSGIENSSKHLATIFISDIERDKDGEIVNENAVWPLLDTRFKESKDIQAVFTAQDEWRGIFESASANDTAEKISRIVKHVHKIDHLKAFL